MPKFVSKYLELVLVMEPAEQGQPGKRIYFHDGQYETEDKKEIAFIRGHKMFNRTISENEDVLVPKRSSKKEE